MDEHLQNLAGSDGLSIHTGFPNPAADQFRSGSPLSLDLNHLLIRRPASTYMFRVAGHQWSDQGVCDGDVAVVERRPFGQPNDLVVSWQGNGFGLSRRRGLGAEAPIWGVVTAVIHQFEA
jgi:DNA polymerase V